MKKIVVFLSFAMIFFSAGARVWAAEPQKIQARKEARTELNNLRTEFKNKKAEILARLKEKFPGLLPAGFNQAKVKTVGTDSLTVEYNNQEITLKLTDKTQILRRYGGKAALSEIKEGDLVSARGDWQDDYQAVLIVRVLRDLSIQQRPVTFWGKIKALNADAKTFTLTVGKRGDIQVDAKAAKIVNRNEKTLDFSALAEGHRVRVSGLWDGKTNLTQVRLIKDWSVSVPK